MEKFNYLLKDKISHLPKNPGVYAFKKGVKFLYIGKAVNLRERVKNHLQQPTYRDNLFINQVSKIGFIKTDSEIEALILEANLIKKYKPKYNVVWRDDKNYFYVAIIKEEFPRIFITHQIRTQKAKLKTQNCNLKLKTIFVGPFVDGTTLKQTLKILRKVFPYRSCNKIPKYPCLWYQLNRCPAPCLLKTQISQQIPQLSEQIKDESQRNAEKLIKILQKGKVQVLKDLKKEMKKASASENFEKAANLRDQILALEKVVSHAKIFSISDQVLSGNISKIVPEIGWPKIQKTLQKLVRTRGSIFRIEAYDVSNIQGKEATGSMVTFIEGKPAKSFYRRFKIKVGGKPNDIAMIKEILSRRFQHPEWPYPQLILIDGGRGQLNAALKIKNLKLKKKDIKLIALAKSNEGERLFIEGREKPILLKNLPQKTAFLLLRLRDEAHRFAIAYHKKLRKLDFLSKP